MSEDIITTQGNTFMISDSIGNIAPGSHGGLFYADTRVLSKFKLTINGKLPELLSSQVINNYAATFYLTAPSLKQFGKRMISIIRDRFVSNGLHEDISVFNYGKEKIKLKIAIDFDADFADIFEVKKEKQLKKYKITETETDNFNFIFTYRRDNFLRQTLISFSQTAKIQGKKAIFNVELEPGAHWKTCLNISLSIEEVSIKPKCRCEQFDAFNGHLANQRKWANSLAKLRSDNHNLNQLYRQSINDLATLRLKIFNSYLVAAGAPWFMTIFGRDLIITALQCLWLEPQLAIDSLRTLAQFQGKKHDEFREEEPGKILHEVRFGELAAARKVPHWRYFGSIDATPLFLILLDETYRWTGNLELIKELLPAAEAALSWIDQYGDIDNDGFVEYQARSTGGLANQGWKDAADAILFANGKQAKAPIALVEVQGYVYRAKLGMVAIYTELGEQEKASRLAKEAAILKTNFNQAFWLDKENFFALALDRDKQQVDSITSNVGQALWTGIIDQDKAHLVAARLISSEMFSGWGIRTMSSAMKGYNPVSYHNGTIWPHDNSLIAAGLAAYGNQEAALKVIKAVIDASAKFPNHQLPELFSGYSRRHKDDFPAPYPTASAPQAWAAGAVLLMMKTILGLKPQAETKTISVNPFLPKSICLMEIDKIQAFARKFHLLIEKGKQPEIKEYKGGT